MAEIENKKISTIDVISLVNTKNTKFLATGKYKDNTTTYLVSYNDLEDTCLDKVASTYPKITNLATMDSNISNNTSDIKTINTTIGSNDTSGLRNRIKTNETNIGNLTTRVLKVEADLTSIGDISKLTSIGEDVKLNKDNIDELSNAIDGLSTIIDNNICLSIDTIKKTAELTADANTYGRIKLGFTTSETDKKYAVTLDSAGKAYVKVPWISYDVDELTKDVNALTALSSCYADSKGNPIIPKDLSDTLTKYNQILMTGSSSYDATPFVQTVPALKDDVERNIGLLDDIYRLNDFEELTGGIIFDLSNSIEELKKAKQGEAFPIGSIYCSINTTNPASTLKYGTWERLGTSSTVLTGIESAKIASDAEVSETIAKTKDIDVTVNPTTIDIYFWKRTE